MISAVSSFLKSEKNRRTLGYYSMFICLGMNLAVLGPTLPALADQTGTRLGMMGSLFLLSAAGYVVGTLLAGTAFDRLPGHPILGSAGLLSAAMLILIPFTHSFPILLVLIIIRGMADGMINTGMSTLILWTHGDDSPPFMTGLHFTFGIGAFISPLIVARALESSAPIGAVYWLLGGISILMSLRMLLAHGSPDPAENNHGGSNSQNRSGANRSIILLTALLLFFYVGAEITFGGWLYSFAVTLELTSEAAAAYLTSAFYLSFTIGRLFAIPVTARIPASRVLTASILACLLILGLGTAFFTSIPVLWMMTIGTGLSMAPVFPAVFSYAGQSIRMNAHASSRILLGDSFGSMALPWLAGIIIEATSPPSMLYLVLGSLILGLGVLTLLLKTVRTSKNISIQA